jgi:hypothetical protein
MQKRDSVQAYVASASELVSSLQCAASDLVVLSVGEQTISSSIVVPEQASRMEPEESAYVFAVDPSMARASRAPEHFFCDSFVERPAPLGRGNDKHRLTRVG